MQFILHYLLFNTRGETATQFSSIILNIVFQSLIMILIYNKSVIFEYIKYFN